MEISDGATTVTPLLWVTAEQRYSSQNKIHRLMSGRVAVTLGRTSPRAGRIGFLFDSEAAATSCIDMHRLGTVFSVQEPTRPQLDMTYVLADGGQIEIEVLTDTDPDADLWMVSIDYQEVAE